jgi:CBS domain-containing protein
MTRDIVTVSPETPLKDAAELLARHRISGLPVLDGGEVVGVVSEADIVARSTGRSGSRNLLQRLTGAPEGPAGATRVGEAMSSPAITISPDQPVAEAARTMVDRKVNRLPVVDGSRLAGIVTRADLVRAYVRPDDELAQEIREEVAGRALWIDASDLEISVAQGAVTLAGEDERKEDADLLERFTAAVPGVVSVRSNLTWRLDEAKLPASDPRVPRPPRDQDR